MTDSHRKNEPNRQFHNIDYKEADIMRPFLLKISLLFHNSPAPSLKHSATPPRRNFNSLRFYIFNTT